MSTSDTLAPKESRSRKLTMCKPIFTSSWAAMKQSVLAAAELVALIPITVQLNMSPIDQLKGMLQACTSAASPV